MAELHLDHQLVAAAQRLATGADIHRVRHLIFAYEQAVSLHNCRWPTHLVYQPEHEAALRAFVNESSGIRFYRRHALKQSRQNRRAI
jgi:hypothetical protein